MAASRTDGSIFRDKTPQEVTEEHLAYIDARLRSLSRDVQEQDEARRRLVAFLIVLAYVFVFAYLMGRDNSASNRRS